jgi:hypothetical protein
MYQVIIKCRPDGNTEDKAEGYQGPSCTEVTKPFIDALGEKISEIPTTEMFQEVQYQEQKEQE